MKTVVFSGPALTRSGYGEHSRQVARWLLKKKDIDVRFVLTPWGDTPWLLNQDDHGGLVGEIMRRATPVGSQADVSFQLKLPNEWDAKMAKFNVGITAAVETDKCHPEWITACNTMDMVIVPSEHAKANLTNTGAITKPLIVVPEAYADACADPDVPSLPDFDTPFNFLVFGQITGNNPHNDRKNTFFTVKWLNEVFKDDPDVGVIIKTNMGRNTLIDRTLTRNVLSQVINETKRGKGPKFYLLHGDMSEKEVAAIYRHPKVKALVSLTRGEGFGLPTLEAAASGLPVIATNWSGHLDFMNQGKFISVFYQLQPVHDSRIDDKIFMKGSRWAEPSEEDFKKRVAKFKDSPTTPREWAADLSKKLITSHSFDAICNAYDEALKGIL